MKGRKRTKRKEERKTTKKKAIAATAFLTTLFTLGIFIPFFWFYSNASPLSNVEVTFEYADGTAINGLEVSLWTGEWNDPVSTNDGKVTFEGLTTTTYYYRWSWQGEDKQIGPIALTGAGYAKTHTLAYWTVKGWFYYGTAAEPGAPVQGLAVKLKPTGVTTPTAYLGWVQFDDLKAGDYVLEWVWGGTQTDGFTIERTDAKLVEKTNYLPLKSGGGINLHLAESVRHALPTAIK